MTDLMDESKVNGAAGMLALGVLSVLTGGVGLGFGSTFFSNGAALNSLGSAWAAGNGSGNSLAITLAPVAAGCAAGAIVAGILSIVANTKKSRVLATVAIVFLIVLSALEFVGGLFFSQLISRSFSILNDEDRGVNFSPDQLAMNDFSVAVHKNCCYNKVIDESKGQPYNEVLQTLVSEIQKPSPICPINPDTCTSSIPPNVYAKLSSLKEFAPLLCTCYTEGVFNKIENHIIKEDSCSAFKEVFVEIPQQLYIPTLPTRLDINDVISLANKEYEAYMPIPSLRLTGQVAPRDPPYVKSTVNGKNFTLISPSEGEVGWACGFGYVKGISWIVNLYLDHVGGTAALVLMICAGAQIFGSILVLAFWLIGGGKPTDEWANYESGVVSPSKSPL